MNSPPSIRAGACIALLTSSLAVTWAARAEDATTNPAPTPDAEAARAALDAALEAEGCNAHEVLEVEQRWYAACGLQGVLVLERTPQGFALRERRVGIGEARAVFLRSGQVWAELERTEAHPVAQLAVSAARAETAPPPRPAMPALPRTDAAVSTSEPPPEPESTIAPRRIGGMLSIEASLRPYLPIDELGFAAIGTLALTYYGEQPWYARAQLMPIGGLVVKGGDSWLFGALASAGYDHALFSIGLGVGTLRQDEREYRNGPEGGGYEVVDEGMRLAVTQEARLGALDGLNLRVHNAFLLDDARWRFGFINVAFQIPAGGRAWIIAEGGGAERAGFFYAEVGLRRLLRGSRASGSLFITPSVGVAGIDKRDDSAWLPGPMVGVRLEWRI